MSDGHPDSSHTRTLQRRIAGALAAGATIVVLIGYTLAQTDAPGAGAGAEAPAAAANGAPTAAPTNATPTAPGRLTSTPPGTPYNQRQQLLQRGQLVYQRYCIGCHGASGDGKGPASARLITKPRDFTSGIYKFRSTDSGSLPMEADLYRTITRGLARVSMPAFPLMPEQDKIAVIQYVKRFFPQWEDQKDRRTLVFIPRAPGDLASTDRIGRGRVVFLAMGCGNCHGQDGAGTGATQSEYIDAWGHPQRAFNFTRGRLKSGDNPEDIYRVFHTGLRSIMPAFGGQTLAYVSAEQAMSQSKFFLEGEPASLDPFLKQFPAATADIGALTDTEREERAQRNSWDLVAYIQSLRQGGGKPTGRPAAAAPPKAPEPDPFK